MTDQCKRCELRGNIKDCLESECYHHENWYAIEQQKEIDRLRNALSDEVLLLKNKLSDCNEILRLNNWRGDLQEEIEDILNG